MTDNHIILNFYQHRPAGSWDDDSSLFMGSGADCEIGINKISGLSAPKTKLNMIELATEDGSRFSGVHVKPRNIHIEASYKTLGNVAEKRDRILKFFSPRLTGTLYVQLGSATEETRRRQIDYVLEGWTFVEKESIDGRVAFVLDLICPQPDFVEPRQMDPISGSGSITVDVPMGGQEPAGWELSVTPSGGIATFGIVSMDDPNDTIGVIGSGSYEFTVNTEDTSAFITMGAGNPFKFLNKDSTPFKLNTPYHPSGIRISSDGAFVADFKVWYHYNGI